MSTVSDLFSADNLVGDYTGPRLGFAQEGGESDFVYSPGYSGPMKDKAEMDRPGGVMVGGHYGGGRRYKKRSTNKKSKGNQKRNQKNQRNRSTRRVRH
jgi:hypothetical protein